MKLAILLVIVCVASASQLNSIVNTKDFAMGLLDGMHASQKVAHSQACFSDIQAAAPKMQEAIADIYTLQPLQMIKGIEAIYETQKALYADGSDCQQVDTESQAWFQQIKDAFTVSENRKRGLLNIIKNLSAIRQDLVSLKANMGTNDFVAGQNLGDILAIYVYGSQTSTMRFTQVTGITSKKDFAIGFFTGMKATDDVAHGLPCIQTIEDDIPKIKDAIAKIQSQSPIQIVEAVEELLTVYKALWSPNSDCQQTVSEGKSWMETIKTAFSDRDHAKQGIENLLKNFEQVLQDIKAFEQFEGTNDFLAGDKLGDIIAIFVYGVQQPQLNSFVSLQGVPHDFTDCSNPAAIIKLSGISFAQNPVKGQKDAMTITGQSSDHVELKNIVMSVKLSGVSIHTESLPISDVLEAGDAFNYDYNVFVPTISPSGDYDITFNINNLQDKSVSCFNVKLSL